MVSPIFIHVSKWSRKQINAGNKFKKNGNTIIQKKEELEFTCSMR